MTGPSFEAATPCVSGRAPRRSSRSRPSPPKGRMGPASRFALRDSPTAGGPTDISTRIVLDKVKSVFGQPFIFDNRRRRVGREWRGRCQERDGQTGPPLGHLTVGRWLPSRPHRSRIDL